MIRSGGARRRRATPRWRAWTVVAAALILSSLASAAPPTGVDIAVSSAALRGHVEALSGIRFRRQSDPAGMEAAVTYIQRGFAAAGLSPAIQHYAFGRGAGENNNVIAVINPEKADVLVLGAHYDAAGDAPGADDNASGVAGLLELARLLQLHRDRLPFQVQCVAYANEEPPFFRTPGMGSFHHAWMLYGQRRRVILMISLESIGYFSDVEGSQAYPAKIVGWLRPTRGNFISLVSSPSKVFLLYGMRRAFARVTDLPVETLCAPRFVRGVDFSDHLNYWRFGFPAMMVTDTAFLRNPNYHTTGDKPDTLDYVRMAKVVTGLAGWLLGA